MHSFRSFSLLHMEAHGKQSSHLRASFNSTSITGLYKRISSQPDVFPMEIETPLLLSYITPKGPAAPLAKLQQSPTLRRQKAHAHGASHNTRAVSRERSNPAKSSLPLPNTLASKAKLEKPSAKYEKRPNYKEARASQLKATISVGETPRARACRLLITALRAQQRLARRVPRLRISTADPRFT